MHVYKLAHGMDFSAWIYFQLWCFPEVAELRLSFCTVVFRLVSIVCGMTLYIRYYVKL